MRKNTSISLKVVEDQLRDEAAPSLLPEIDDEKQTERIRPLAELPGLKPILNVKPQRVQLPVEDLYVDKVYQRNRSERSDRHIVDMVTQWDWALFVEPLVYRNAKGQYHLIDGQHTAIAWLSHPQLPAMIDVDLIESITTVQEAARAFASRNTRRLVPHILQIYKAALAGNEEWAVALYKASSKAGVHIPFTPGFSHKSNTVLAVAELTKLLSARGEDGLDKVLKTIAVGNFKPIRETHLKAVDALLFDERYKGFVHQSRLQAILRKLNDNEVQGHAAATAIAMKMRRWEALVIRYFREYQAEFGGVPA
jgi:hypothetical protein